MRVNKRSEKCLEGYFLCWEGQVEWNFGGWGKGGLGRGHTYGQGNSRGKTTILLSLISHVWFTQKNQDCKWFSSIFLFNPRISTWISCTYWARAQGAYTHTRGFSSCYFDDDILCNNDLPMTNWCSFFILSKTHYNLPKMVRMMITLLGAAAASDVDWSHWEVVSTNYARYVYTYVCVCVCV